MEEKALKELIEKAIAEYNMYRSPEAKAKLIEINKEKNQIIVEFKGPFCRSCGIYDYFEDLIYELKRINNEVKIKINSIEEFDYEKFIVKYDID